MLLGLGLHTSAGLIPYSAGAGRPCVELAGSAYTMHVYNSK